MTLEELIEKLKNCDSECNVYVLFSEDNPLDCADSITNVFEIKCSSQSDYNGVYLQVN